MDRYRDVPEDPRSDPVHHHAFTQDIPSSPPSIVSEAGTRRKPKRPPPVTPRSFKRFFTPRSSLHASVGSVHASRQALKELSTTSLNRRGPAFTKARTPNASNAANRGILKNPFTEITKTPSRKRKLSFSSPGSPPQSSPIRKVRLATAVQDDRIVEKTVNEIEITIPPETAYSPRKSIQKQLFFVNPVVEPVRRSKVLATSGEYCLRSVTGRMNRLTMRYNYGSGEAARLLAYNSISFLTWYLGQIGEIKHRVFILDLPTFIRLAVSLKIGLRFPSVLRPAKVSYLG